MGTQVIRVRQIESSFPGDKFFPIESVHGQKSLSVGSMGSSYYYVSNVIVYTPNSQYRRYVQAAITYYNHSHSETIENAYVEATTPWAIEPQSEIPLSNLVGQYLYKNDSTATRNCYVEYFTTSAHTVTAGAGGSVKGSGGEELKINGSSVGYCKGTRTYTATANTGYKFTSWTVTSGTVSQSNNTLSVDCSLSGNDVIAVANFQVWASYKITYQKNDGSGSTLSQTISAGNTGTVKGKSAFSRPGYVFDGWSTTSSGSVVYAGGESIDNSQGLGGTLTLYAHWTPITYTIYFNPNGGNGSGEYITATYDSPWRTPQASIAGDWPYHTFQNWGGYNANTQQNDNLTTTANATVTINANWSQNTKTISFSNTNSAIASVRINNGSPSTSSVSSTLDEGTTCSLYITFTSAYNAHKYAVTQNAGGGAKEGNIVHGMTPASDTEYVYSFLVNGSSPTSFQTYYVVQSTSKINDSTSSTLDANHVTIDGGTWVGGTQPTVTLTPAADDATDGWFNNDIYVHIDYGGNDQIEFVSWSGDNIGSSTNPDTPFYLSTNTTLYVNFKPRKVTVSCKADERFEGAGTCSVSDYHDQCGQSVTFSATPYSGYQFSGWYDDGGELKSSDATYTFTLTGDVSLTGRFKAAVTVDFKKKASAQASGTVTIDEETPSATSCTKYVELGQTCTIKANCGNYYFAGWFNDADFDPESYENFTPIDAESEQLMYVDGPVTYHAMVLDALITYYIAFYGYENATSEIKNNLVSWSIGTSGTLPTGVTSITKAQYESGLRTKHDDNTIEARSEYGLFFSVAGVKRIPVTVQSVGSLGLSRVDKYLYSDDIANEPIASDNDGDFTTTVAKDYDYVARVGDPAKRVIRLLYATGSSSANGLLYVNGTPNSAEVEEGSTVSISASSENGYRLMGWYRDVNLKNPISENNPYTFRVGFDATIYARFVQDTNAIYEWEGDTRNKTAEWRSKTFATARPHRPVCVRVDSVDYDPPVTMVEVGMFSSPSSAPSSIATLNNVIAQDMRRLPQLRPERFMQICVRHSAEIDTVVVGDNAQEMT